MKMIIGKFKVFIDEVEDNGGFIGIMEKYPHYSSWARSKDQVVTEINSKIRIHNQKVIDKFPN